MQFLAVLSKRDSRFNLNITKAPKLHRTIITPFKPLQLYIMHMYRVVISVSRGSGSMYADALAIAEMYYRLVVSFGIFYFQDLTLWQFQGYM